MFIAETREAKISKFSYRPVVSLLWHESPSTELVDIHVHNCKINCDGSDCASVLCTYITQSVSICSQSWMLVHVMNGIELWLTVSSPLTYLSDNHTPKRWEKGLWPRHCYSLILHLFLCVLMKHSRMPTLFQCLRGYDTAVWNKHFYPLELCH